MRKILTLIVICITAMSAHAQSFKFGTIAADVNAGFGTYGIKAHSPVNGDDVSGIAFIGTLPEINAEFGILKFLGVGVHYRRGTYGKSSGGKARGNDIGLNVNFHLANKKDKFDLPIGVAIGGTTLYAPVNTTDYFKGKGTLINVHVSPHIYFGKYIGMTATLGYNKHVLGHIEAVSNGKVYTEADGATWKMGGVYFEIGIAGKFDLFKKKE
ncbi:MAG: hypothetical protein JWP12_569 [Bacteroidetes bacterium]|nr:hypothetical protein [Bacteroidota bacterium]